MLDRPLEWNPMAERFAGGATVLGLLDQPSRQGFELPEC